MGWRVWNSTPNRKMASTQNRTHLFVQLIDRSIGWMKGLIKKHTFFWMRNFRRSASSSSDGPPGHMAFQSGRASAKTLCNKSWHNNPRDVRPVAAPQEPQSSCDGTSQSRLCKMSTPIAAANRLAFASASLAQQPLQTWDTIGLDQSPFHKAKNC